MIISYDHPDLVYILFGVTSQHRFAFFNPNPTSIFYELISATEGFYDHNSEALNLIQSAKVSH